ncbi:AAA family ATPase [Limnofasciculus baicalensis]|uniref:ATP-binding protein n=1 Tax=Limnofasciculus baicalensis BBK-W-15 TaxID=2699891 RepID=A0AAE3GXF2_9CYAN|nr:ATP-binding protein [Limnofasciculus baicalensis]MCP2732309.1 ATP-binding protein [Limnofasciculus baicalensis BBK-W-15]
MTAASPSICPFLAGGMLTERMFFVGRDDEIRFIIQNMANAQPTSINIVGDRKIGKSSLLYHIYQTYEERVPGYGRQPQDFVVVYLSLKSANCRKPDDFYQAVAQELLSRGSVQANPALAQPLQVTPFDVHAFSQAMGNWKQAKVLPVICLDDFQELLEPNSLFDDQFYDNLRSIEDRSQLMLVIGSRKKLKDYTSRESGRTSGFFNVSQTYILQGFSPATAMDLVRLPGVNNPALSEERQNLAIKWSEGQPYLLQLAGKCLWEAQKQDRPSEWAQRRFEEDANQVPTSRNYGRMIFMAIGRIGFWGQNLGNTADDWSNFLKGMITIVTVLLLLFGVEKWQDFTNFMQQSINDILQNAQTKEEENK